jgi:voltage-gated potassium channel
MSKTGTTTTTAVVDDAPAVLVSERSHFVEDVVSSPALLLQRLGPPLLALLTLFVGGGAGYYALGHLYARSWSLLDCVWMSVISITTVGYGEVFPLDFPAVRFYTMALLVLGMGAGVWAMSSVTAFFVEGHLGLFFRERALEKRIGQLNAHTIVCGLSASSEHVVQEHLVTGRSVVLVDPRHELAQKVHARWPELAVVIGDSSDDDVLGRAGIARARSLVCCLDTDRDNLFLVITARQLQPALEIIVECDEQASVSKFKAAGATHVVNPSFIGGMRIASQVLRPSAVAFLDQMLRSGDARVSEVVVHSSSVVVDKTIAQAQLQQHTGLRPVAIKPAGSSTFVYSPDDATVLRAGDTLIVMGERARVSSVEAVCGPR